MKTSDLIALLECHADRRDVLHFARTHDYEPIVRLRSCGISPDEILIRLPRNSKVTFNFEDDFLSSIDWKLGLNLTHPVAFKAIFEQVLQGIAPERFVDQASMANGCPTDLYLGSVHVDVYEAGSGGGAGGEICITFTAPTEASQASSSAKGAAR